MNLFFLSFLASALVSAAPMEAAVDTKFVLVPGITCRIIVAEHPPLTLAEFAFINGDSVVITGDSCSFAQNTTEVLTNAANIASAPELPCPSLSATEFPTNSICACAETDYVYNHALNVCLPSKTNDIFNKPDPVVEAPAPVAA